MSDEEIGQILTKRILLAQELESRGHWAMLDYMLECKRKLTTLENPTVLDRVSVFDDRYYDFEFFKYVVLEDPQLNRELEFA
jgi:hypothetical protein